jgi:polyhydroxyalkanoate synthase subunit PhaC
MENAKHIDLQELTEGITRASQKIIKNYTDNKSGYDHDKRDIEQAYIQFGSKLIASPEEMEKLQAHYQNYFKSQTQLWEQITGRLSGNTKDYTPVITPDEGDKRFKAPEWEEAPFYFDFVKQSYLLVSKLVGEIVDNSDIDDKTKKKLTFYSKQYMDAFSPSNFIATNPEAIKLAQQTNGQSLVDGFNNFLSDVETGKISQTDMSAFEPGKNIAITPGEVVYENELMQLIQYTPTTEKVYETPLVIIPPWINKYYILDLRPENSLVKFMVDQGFTTYIISWKNPTLDMGHITFDNYVELGALKAIEVAQSVSKSKKVNTLGYCLGGTLLSTTLAILASKENQQENPVNSATLLAAMVDFSDVGPMGDVIDNALIKKMERGELLKDGVMHGYDMEKAFNLIRANDLIWRYVVSNYLKGKNPTPFDVLYWTNDNTNLPAKMYLFYLKKMVLENKLSRKNALRICDTPIDIGKIAIPILAIGLDQDHISPPHTVFTTTELVSGPIEYILGESGHVMGTANHPSKEKYGYFKGGELGHGLENWKKSAEFHQGSWWTAWSEWLDKKSGKHIAASKKLGNDKFKSIEPAPGRYVKEKCDTCFSKANNS